jgi:hypothetical protein
MDAYQKHGSIISKEPDMQFDPYSFEELDFKFKFSAFADRFTSHFNEPTPRLFEATASSALGVTRNVGGAREVIRDVLSGRYNLSKLLLGLEEEWKRNRVDSIDVGDESDDGCSVCSTRVAPDYDFVPSGSGIQYDEEGNMIDVEPIGYTLEELQDLPDEKGIFNMYKTVDMTIVDPEGTNLRRTIEIAPSSAFDHTLISQDFLDCVPTDSQAFTEIFGLPCPKLKDVIQLAQTEPVIARVYAISEPLKARLITKGPPLRYWISRFFQKAMWQYLQGYAAFSLTGRPLIISDLNSLVNRANKIGFKFDSFVSGDYSAATDGLDINFTKICFESFLSHCSYSDDLTEILRSVLYEHFITYPINAFVPSFAQKNGQLMGSTLSFPILCMVNFICYWMSMEEYMGSKINIHDLPVLVNGDDILFPSNSKLYKIWLKNIKKVGFKLSIGKNYVHRSILTINSQCYSYFYGTEQFVPIKFLNCGLLTGQSKKGGSISSRSDQSLTSIYNEVIESSPNPVRTHKRFLFYYRDIIDKHTKFGTYTMNLFADINYGGLGFKNESIEPNFTETQRLMGALNERQVKQ